MGGWQWGRQGFRLWWPFIPPCPLLVFAAETLGGSTGAVWVFWEGRGTVVGLWGCWAVTPPGVCSCRGWGRCHGPLMAVGCALGCSRSHSSAGAHRVPLQVMEPILTHRGGGQVVSTALSSLEMWEGGSTCPRCCSESSLGVHLPSVTLSPTPKWWSAPVRRRGPCQGVPGVSHAGREVGAQPWACSRNGDGDEGLAGEVFAECGFISHGFSRHARARMADSVTGMSACLHSQDCVLHPPCGFPLALAPMGAGSSTRSSLWDLWAAPA